MTTYPSGAEIKTSAGHSCSQSPCTFKVKRKQEFTVFAEKPGYSPEYLEIKTKVSKGGAATLAGNVVAGGIIGHGVDAAIGAAMDHYPNPAHINLLALSPAKNAEKHSQKSPPKSNVAGRRS